MNKKVLIGLIASCVAMGAVFGGIFLFKHEHIEVIDPAVSPTCTEFGLTEGKHCSNCGEVLIARKRILALGHEEVVDNAVASTCIKTGLTEGKHCSVCGTILKAQTTTPISNLHKESSWIIDKEAGKTESGLKHTECIDCGQKMNEEIVEATGSIGLEYSVNYLNQCYVSSKGNCKDQDVVIPDTYNGKPVEWISQDVFKGNMFLDSVVIGNNVSSIGADVFKNCEYLKTVTLGDSVTNIGSYAFSNCLRLTSVTMPVSVTLINKYAFENCGSIIIYYEGTMEQWYAIRKANGWKNGSSITVYCTDGKTY